MQNANDVVFEYLIDQLRQQVNKKDVTSFDVSVQISDLDEVKQVIHNLQQHIAGKDDEIRALKDSLRQQVNSNQCEDLAQEVQSLKNQLRDASALVAELQEIIKLMNEDFNRVTGRGGSLPKGESYVVGEHGPEKSGCCKGDVQESCWIEWSGGACPVPSGTLVDVIYRDGETLYGLRADEFNDTKRDASSSFWQHDGALNDIVRYRRALHQ